MANLPFKVGDIGAASVFPVSHFLQLNNPDLFRENALVGGNWIESKTSKRFDVVGTFLRHQIVLYEH